VSNGEDLTTRLMDNMDPQLLDFVKTKVNSFIKWDLVRFFHDNPNVADTVENIARCAGRNPAAVRPEIDDLVGCGVMDRQESGDLVTYSLASDPSVRRVLNAFVRASRDRHFRVKAVYHIIRGMR